MYGYACLARRAANRLLQTKPGSWFVCLCDDLLSRVPVFPRWSNAEACWGASALGNEVAFRLLHDAVAGQITRLGRGVSRWLAVERRRHLQAARYHQSSIINSCRTIQRLVLCGSQI